MERLNFFPFPYPDECFYSIFARYYVRSGIISSKAATEKFFGNDRSILASTVFLPRKMERMNYWIDPVCGLTAAELICSHTTYPYQSISFTKELYLGMEHVIKEGIPKTGMYPLERRMIAKISNSSAGRYLRYCPECVREDISKYGETYWHRLPQLPGVRYCPKHVCLIRNSTVPIEELRVRIYPASYVLRCKDVILEEGQNINIQFLSISKDIEWLLKHGREFGGHQEISRKYREIMKARGYANFYDISNREAIKKDFQDFFGEALITEIFGKTENPFYWLRYLQESIGFNLKPLHHVLLMEFFAGSAEQFAKMEVRTKIPYGSDTGVCINKLCQHYLQNTANRRKLKTMRDEVWAWFECPYCGMRYRRSNQEQSFAQYLKKPCITDRGFLYHEQLERYLDDTQLPIREIADKLYVKPRTIEKYATENGIDMSGHKKICHYTKESDDGENRDAYFRRRVLEELEKTPVMSCKDLKECVPGAYNWFIRKDPEWIHARLIHESDKPRWDEWGKTALIELKAAYEEIQSSGDSRKRVNISWLARAAGIDRDKLYDRLPYLPEMQDFFNEVCETQEAWIRRRYTELATEKKTAGGKEFTYDDVKRKVQIRRDSYRKNKALIEELIVELNNTLFKDKE